MLLMIGRSCFFVVCPGTFAIVSLMTAEALDGIQLESVSDSNNQSSSQMNEFDPVIASEKVGLATTLAFLIGAIQVNCKILKIFGKE